VFCQGRRKMLGTQKKKGLLANQIQTSNCLRLLPPVLASPRPPAPLALDLADEERAELIEFDREP
jgi:hypothetical protein